jgi:hypothetical protein
MVEVSARPPKVAYSAGTSSTLQVRSFMFTRKILFIVLLPPNFAFLGMVPGEISFPEREAPLFPAEPFGLSP